MLEIYLKDEKGNRFNELRTIIICCALWAVAVKIFKLNDGSIKSELPIGHS